MQKLTENEDLRVRRTRKLLQQALIELTVEKGFAAVTVRDITERAMVNRSTFYRHYLDKYELLDQY
ncbi:MAG TPA: TetR family transcriptional regulator, partial [Phototrophicaceae bacterium]|nr:TetR family transcriptional regulator [Phototrophicaceae bacterium]